ncbi:MAG: aminoacyl-histidine dipeptidase, partial [Bacteroidales bacterium]|nr:aminoacyl-histidine dipeptidase [Bacteroidales bacterium]
MDMVCEKNSDVKHDFDNDPIQPVIDGDWVTAKGTTLGADDGIGIAAQLAILSSTDIIHGPVECLFTVDEETGLTGAFALQPGFLEGRVLINLDSEDEGELFIGCAGGIDTVATFKYKHVKTPNDSISYKISISGLKGGHSGDDINKGFGNSVKILTRLLWNASNDLKIHVAHFDGGNLRNAIAREATAIITIKPKRKERMLAYVESFSNAVKEELSITEPGLSIQIEETGMPKTIVSKKIQNRLLNSLYACPHGVISMSQKMPGMVETSTNLASVKFRGKNRIEVTTSQRSDSSTAKLDIAHMVENVFRLARAKVTHSDGYPGWAPNPASNILKITEKAYKDLFRTDPVVRSIHAGLECGLFLEKYPDMDMISFGPTLRRVHSPDERINIETVRKFWELLLEVLKHSEAR